jgi:hypothetical protein
MRPFSDDEKLKVDIRLDYSVTIHTNRAVEKRFKKWRMFHKGKLTLELCPTGIHTALTLRHEETGSTFDLTDYECI